MDNRNLGQAIAFLRKRAGYTQRELAELLDISDKAVSKWERGLSYPDISLLAKLSILLGTDIESLLEGNVTHFNQTWRGVLIFDDVKNEISASTLIYDKPIVYYLISYFLLVGISEILILCSQKNRECMKSILGEGKDLGLRLIYTDHSEKQEYRDFVSEHSVMVVYDKILLYGMDLTKSFQRAMAKKDGITLLATLSRGERDSKKIVFDANRRVIAQKCTIQKDLQEAYHTIPILFCGSGCLQVFSLHVEDIVKSLENLEREGILYVEALGRGMIEFGLQSLDDLIEASEFVRLIQRKQKEYVFCIEEIAWRRGLISKKELKILGEKRQDTEYGNYILELCKD